jgi:hypothetical protein
MHFSYKTPEDASGSTIMGGPPFVSEAEDVADGVRICQCGMQAPYSKRPPQSKVWLLGDMYTIRCHDVNWCCRSTDCYEASVVGLLDQLIPLSLPKSVQLFARASKAATLVETDTQRSDSEVAEAAMRIISGNDENISTGPNAGVITMGSISQNGSSSINRGGYATVAMAAHKAGRTGVANLLLMLESSVADKVPALISIGLYADAMAVATSAR